VARLGDSFVLAATQYGGAEIATVRGTAKRKLQTPEQAGCKEGEVQKSYGPSERPAITPEVIESTPDGSLVSIGRGGRRPPAPPDPDARRGRPRGLLDPICVSL
jgi:hypothetical protein